MKNKRRGHFQKSLALAMVLAVCSVQDLNVVFAETAQPPTLETTPPLYLLTYDHGGLVLWGPDHFVKYLRNAVEWLDRYPGFKIGLDNEAYTYDELAEHHPEVLDELRRCLKRYAGRLGIGTCTYGQPLSQFINEESNIRQIGYALEADRRHLGCAPTVYLMSEHAMHSQIPQILAGFDFTGAIMRTHFMMYGYNPTFDVPVGWWVGLDGSRIPAVPTYKDEGAQFGRTTVDNWILTRHPSPESPMSLGEFREKFKSIRPLLASRADDSSLRREELVRRYEGKRGFQWILLDELFAVFPKPTQELKTGPNDFAVRMPWGYCGNEIWNMSRRAEVKVLTAERLAASELLLGGKNHEAELDRAWKNLLVAQHHDIQICGLLKDARKFLPASIAISEGVADASLRYIASQMKSDGLAQLTVFNPLSWPRSEWIEVPISLPRAAAKAVGIRRGERAIPSALLSADLYSDGSIREGRIAFLADVPGLSLVSYSLVSTKETSPKPADGIEIHAEGLRIRTPHVFLNFHLEGNIDSLTDGAARTHFLQPGLRNAVFAGQIDGRDCESRGRWAIEPARNSAPWAIARQSGLIGSIPFTLEIKVGTDTSRLDCRATFQFDGQKIGLVSDNKRDSHSPFVHEKKLRFKLFSPVGEKAPAVRDLPFAIAETSNPYVEGNYWTALGNVYGGIAFFNRGTMGAVRESDGGFSIPLAYAMYYVWGTRMLTGEYTYEFALYPFVGDWRAADLHRRALEYNFPLVAISAECGSGRLGDEVRALDVPSSDVIVSAFYSKAGKIYARMYEHRGQTSRAALDFPLGKARLTEVNLAGRELQEVRGPLSFAPWKFRTVRIEPFRE